MTNNDQQEKKQEAAEVVLWDEKYATGIEVIDTQHKQLVELTNQLYVACIAKPDILQTVFKEAMHKMVEYVHFHFDAEIKLLKEINFPQLHEHKKMHDDLIKNILNAAKDYNEGKHFVPNHFVRTLKDWIFSHIAIHDKTYSFFVKEQLHNGKLTEQALKI
ncbi:MAG: bacteriohemerythrin [Treponema sp.]|nr:bacteriohemerythrin [Treponema sp.]